MESYQREGKEHEGSDDGLVGGVGQVGVAQQAVHGTRVDGRVEQIEKGDLFVAEESADEENGQGDEGK